MFHRRVELRLLALAAALDWPPIAYDFCDERITIPGGEAGWRAWTAAEDWDIGDELNDLWLMLEWAQRMTVAGKDPGPRESWFEKALLSAEALYGMEIEADGHLFG